MTIIIMDMTVMSVKMMMNDGDIKLMMEDGEQ